MTDWIVCCWIIWVGGLNKQNLPPPPLLALRYNLNPFNCHLIDQTMSALDLNISYALTNYNMLREYSCRIVVVIPSSFFYVYPVLGLLG